MRSLRSYLVSMAILLVVVLGAATALVARQVDAYGRAQNERQLLDTTRALSLVVDGQLRSYEATLTALKTSGAIRRGDWRTFDARAREVLAGSDAWIVVGDRQGRQVVNTRLPPGAPLPSGPPPDIWSELDRGQDRVCDLARGFLEPRILCVDAPIMEGGRAAYVISVIFKPTLLTRVLSHDSLREERYVSVLDRQGVVIWRNVAPERFIGTRPPDATWKAMRERGSGVMASRSLEGVPTLVAFSRSPLSGWTFVVGVPRHEIDAPRRHALWWGLGVAFAALALGGLVGLLAARRVADAVRHLSAAAQRIRDGEAPGFQPSGLVEIDAVGQTLTSAIAERDASQERFRLAQEVGGIGAWEWDLVRDEGHVSEAYREMHGLPEGPAPLKIAQVLAVIHPDDLPGYQQRLAAAKSRAEPSSNDYRVIRPDGSVRWIYAKGRPIFGADGEPVRALGVVMDLTDRKVNEERLQLLMREVDHRANNLMAVVQGAVSLSRADDPVALREVILGRIEALARAHQLLAASRWRGADLRRLAEEELRAFTIGDGQRVSLWGEATPLSPAAAQALAMALHELATNAAKHGALSVPTGCIDLRWQVEGGRLQLTWAESGGPPVKPPKRRGFGTTVLERAVGGPLRGSTDLDWRADGLVCRIELPLGDEAEE